MKLGQMRNLLLVLLLITTGLSALLLQTPAEGEARGPAYYHNGYIHLNVTHYNGTPAVNSWAKWRSAYFGQETEIILDSRGEGTLNLTFSHLGLGTLTISTPPYGYEYREDMNVDPDEVLYRNITLPLPPEPINIITGILRNVSSMEPISDVEIRMSTTTDHNDYISIYNTTDQDGRYHFEIQNISNYFIFLYSPQTDEYYQVSEAFPLKEGVHQYDLDLYARPKFKGDITSRIRFVRMPGGEPIMGSISVDTYAVDNAYEWFHGEQSGPDGNGWLNYTTSIGESYLNIYPTLNLFQSTWMYITYYLLQNGTSTEKEVPVDLSNFVPVRINIRNTSDPISGAYLYGNFQGVEDFGMYTWSYNNNTNTSGSLIVHLPINGIYSVSVGASGHHHRAYDIDTTRPGPFEYNITLEEAPQVIPPLKTTVNITCLDDETGIPAQYILVEGGGNYNGNYYSFSGYTDSDGILRLEVDAITYDYIYAYFNLAYGEILDIEILSGEPNNITIRMQRREMEDHPDPEPFHLYTVDEDGDPVPNVTLFIYGMFKDHYYDLEFTSEQDGRIDFIHVPDEALTIKINSKLRSGEWNPWVIQTIEIYPGSSETRLPDVTVYPRLQPVPITGVIKDGSTMEPFRFQKVYCRSIKPMEPTRANGISRAEYLDGLEYIDMYRYSKSDGFYRVYGTGTAVLEVHREGYFVYMEEVQIEPTRADVVHDIHMEPLPESMAWLNGTLVDQDGLQISGELNITDIDHPGEIGHDIIINETGEFSIELWPSNYAIKFFNESLEDAMNVELTADGIEDLELMLIPYSEISGRVLDQQGEPVEGINVTLMGREGNGTWLVDWSITEADGNFSFIVEAGTYEIDIAGTALYEHYVVHDIEVNGWNYWYNSLYLTNRTYADVSGTVLGTAGPYADGVPYVFVGFLDGDDIVIGVQSEPDGSFLLEDVPHGTYTLLAQPSETYQPEPGFRSGYKENRTENFVVSGIMVNVDPILEYEVNTPAENVTIDYHAPTGEGVYLDEPITIAFSRAMERNQVMNAVTIVPEVQDLTFHWDEYQRVVTITHDDLEPDTFYIVTIGTGAISIEGYPLMDEIPFSWNFTTGNMTDPWNLTSVDVSLVEMELTVEIEAPANQTIFICIYDAGYFQLSEVSDGQYEIVITEENFEYDTRYSYFFTDELNGMDKLPEFSGTFTTPAEPVPEWEITDAEVKVLSGGDWKVRVEGNPGLDIYIVIEGVGSFKLQEEAPGDYAINIPYTEFEKGESYDYHFSDAEGGEVEAPEWSGTGTDPRGDTTVGADTPWALIIFLLVIIILLIIGIIVVALVLANRKKEEGEDWGDEE